MSHSIQSIDRTVRDNTATISVTYELDGRIFTISAVEDDAIIDALTDFVNGKLSDSDFVATLCGNDRIEANRERVRNTIHQLSENLSSDGDHVWYRNQLLTSDAIAIDPALEQHLIRLLKDDKDHDELIAWTRFTERLYGNECRHTRSHIMRWLMAQKWLTLDKKGRLIGYRGCAWDYDKEIPVSVHAGPAIVDGIQMKGNIPNTVGSIVEMPRTSVQHDPSIGCSSGLHVGTFDYAFGWAPTDGAIIRVAVAPEDIVSVPTECASSKIRCCRFEVLDCERKPATDENLKERCYNQTTYFSFACIQDEPNDDEEDRDWDAEDLENIYPDPFDAADSAIW